MERQGQGGEPGTPKESRKRRGTGSEPGTEAKAAKEEEFTDVSSRRQQAGAASPSASSGNVDVTDGKEKMDTGLERESKENPATQAPTTLPAHAETLKAPATSTAEEPSATHTVTLTPTSAVEAVPSTSSGYVGGGRSRITAMGQYRQPSTDSTTTTSSTDSSSMAMTLGTDDERDTTLLPEEGSIPAHAIGLGGLTLGLQEPPVAATVQEGMSCDISPRHATQKRMSDSFKKCTATVMDILKKVGDRLLPRMNVLFGASEASEPSGLTDAPGAQLSPEKPEPLMMAATDQPDTAPPLSGQNTTAPTRPSVLMYASAACASTSGAMSQPSGSAGPSQTRSPPVLEFGASGYSLSPSEHQNESSPKTPLIELTDFLHTKHPDLFLDGANTILSILAADPNGKPDLDAPPLPKCTHSDEQDCWLLKCQRKLNEVLVPCGLEIVRLHMRTYTLRHVGEDPTKAETPVDIRDVSTPDRQRQVKRADFVIWLLRVHRCIASLRLNLMAVTPVPGTFCKGWQLHGGYMAIQLGVKYHRTGGREEELRMQEHHGEGHFGDSPPRETLLSFLAHVTLLTELSFFGLSFSLQSDDTDLRTWLSANKRLRKLSFEQCDVMNSNLETLIDVALDLKCLEDFTLSLLNKDEPELRDHHLKQLFLRKSHLKKLCLEVNASFVPLCNSLSFNLSVTDLHIKTLVNVEIFRALQASYSAKGTLRTLTLNVNFSSMGSSDNGRDMLVRFMSETGLECLTLETPLMTQEAAEAIADGLELNGMPAESGEITPFLQKLYIKCSPTLMTHENLQHLVRALDVNTKLHVIDVGLVMSQQEEPNVTRINVTEEVLKFTQGRRIPWESPGDITSGKVLFPLAKAYYSKELKFLIDAMRHGMYFHKLTILFECFTKDKPTEDLKNDFNRFLALLSYYDTREEIKSLTLDFPFIDIPGALGLSTLCSMSPSLTELSVNCGHDCSSMTSILLFEGVARSKSIRKLTASGCCLEQPVPKWFEYMCKESTTLQDVHIHVYNLSDEPTSIFLSILPETLNICSSPLFKFRLTHGETKDGWLSLEGRKIIEINETLFMVPEEEKDVYIPEVLSILRMGQSLPAEAVRLLVDLEKLRTETQSQQPGQQPGQQEMPPVHWNVLTRARARAFCWARHKPGFEDYVRDSTAWSAEKVVSEVKRARELISRDFPRLTMVCKVLQEAVPSPDDQLRFMGLLDENRVLIYNRLEIQDVYQERNERPVDEMYQKELVKLEETLKGIFENEKNLLEVISRDLSANSGS